MPNTKNEITDKNKGTIFSILGAWALSVIFVLFGIRYSMVTTLTLGIFHFFLGSLLILMFTENREKIDSNISDSHEGDEESDLRQNQSAKTADESFDSDDKLRRRKWFDLNRFGIVNKLVDVRYSLSLALVSAGIIVVQILMLVSASSVVEFAKPPIWIGVVQIILSFAYLMLMHWMFSKSNGNDEYEVFGLMSRCGQIVVFITGVSVVLSALGINQLELVFVYIVDIICIIIFFDFLIAGFNEIRKKDASDLSTIKLHILSTILNGSNADESIIDRIEDKIGVSLRSSWTVKFVRKSIPVIIVFIVLVLWGMTAFVEVGPQSEGIVYRFGRIISEEPITPGLHVKLPWPIDTVKTYPVYKTQYFTVGYETGEKDDYLWTSVHGGEEYKLLLGDGKELVSINITVHYNINDLKDYVTHSSNPAEILQAKAYEKMMKLIASSDLDTLLSEDRAMLAGTMMDQLKETSEAEDYGIEVLGVAITSIHPPVEVAANYQELVSAQIQKQVIISEALMQREVDIPNAQQSKDETISDALIDYEQRHSEAVGDTIQIVSNKEAYDYSPQAYQTRIWKDAFAEYLSSRKYYIIDQRIIDGEGEIWMDSYE